MSIVVARLTGKAHLTPMSLETLLKSYPPTDRLSCQIWQLCVRHCMYLYILKFPHQTLHH